MKGGNQFESREITRGLSEKEKMLRKKMKIRNLNSFINSNSFPR